MKKIRYFFEAMAFYILFGFFKILPLDTASDFGGWIGRTIGPRLGVTRKAHANLRLAFPDMTKLDRDKVIKDMWDNLGRVIGEYPHMKKIARDRIEHADQTVLNAIKNDDNASIIFSVHMGNWEMATLAMHLQGDLKMGGVYRPANNRWVDKLMNRARRSGGPLTMIPKSKSGTRLLLRELGGGTNVGFMIDQKYNEGEAIDFFGHSAMTGTAFIQMAQKLNCQLMGGRIERLQGANFKLHLIGPMTINNKEGSPRSTKDVMNEVHAITEDWIKKSPAQWLWLHKRWPDKIYEKLKN